MATESGGNRNDEVKTKFAAREGTYTLQVLSEYSRPTRSPYSDAGNFPVTVSFTQLSKQNDTPERLAFSIGRELYVYPFKGIRKAADLTQPTDKRTYKGTFPTCHAFSEVHGKPEESLRLLIGFSAGQIQVIDPFRNENGQLYNHERAVEKSKVTCVAWLPGNNSQFLVAYASGSMYVYCIDSQTSNLPPVYQVFKQGENHIIFTCKTKSTRNPMFRWVIGDGAINQFRFSPCNQYLAVVSQDGFLRVFDFHTMDMVGYMKSYFGGLHCISWSPDGKYLVTGGEDDLITIYSFHENRVICRGRGHRSWVTSISFDPYTTSAIDNSTFEDVSDEESPGNAVTGKSPSARSSTSSRFSIRLDADGSTLPLTTYRVGSVSQDTNICLWDVTSDVLNSHLNRNRTNSHIARNSTLEIDVSHTQPSSVSSSQSNSLQPGINSNSAPNLVSLPSPQPSIGNGTKVKRNFTLGHKDKHSVRSSSALAQCMRNTVELQGKLLGTQYCPRLGDVPLLEPLTCKKLAHSMLTSINFYRDFIVIASQDGVVSSYARPNKQLLAIAPSHDSSDHQLSNHVSSRSRSQTHHLNGYAERAPPPSHMVSRGSAQW